MSEHFRIGVDIGGTFTDFTLFNDDERVARTHKRLTTPDDPSRAVIEGTGAITAEAGLSPADIGTIVHGTTLVTNAVIERRGVSTAMLVTKGFRDLLDIGAERRYDLFDLTIAFPKPVVPRALRVEVPGRLRYDGSEVEALDLVGVDDALSRLVDEHGVRSVAICFLHSHVDVRHEAAAAEFVTARFPQLAVSTSSDIFPFVRELGRWTTTTLNAYVQPVVDRYLDRLEGGLRQAGFAGKLLVMSSSGGTLTPAMARRYPVRLLESGPAAGALMSARHGADLGLDSVLSFDMGGTTAKGCFVRNGRPLKRYDLEVARVHEFRQGSGLTVKIPVLDMIEIGVGGGSIAQVDDRGLIAVGPVSAGAEPGPACYGRGGAGATLTDANLLLGYLDAGSFLGGSMRLVPEAARVAMDANLAGPMGVEVMRAAFGVREVGCESVARAFRTHAAEQGVDLRKSVMVAFGGSGPLHGARVARKLGVRRLVCPNGSGVMSAFGLLSSPLAYEVVRARRLPLDETGLDVLRAEMAAMMEDTTAVLTAAGAPAEAIRHIVRLDMRYRGQGYEVEVELPGLDACTPETLEQAFAVVYARTFGLAFPGQPAEIVNWKVEAIGPAPGDGTHYRLSVQRASATALKGYRPAWSADAEAMVPHAVYDRYALVPGTEIEGPALIEERESTCVLAPGDRLSVDPALNLIIDIGA
ncbi:MULTISPECIES: hydantoinase/oxoprolinase family protein [unclassified Chelatococcus]|uniref:hydantoinase/oxoprolinase family protein n=1 Tax=unclassified Chelatococcus TaxID=2638111 RepID=UPI001BD12875|nr:hydantoinase/oxoprolinase family protein [Chelatococcus sp.]MBS7742403.1 hydantoinase/oxoprolinase family protein [Chelatococcus sp. HY11]CAH1656798.1 N-methylhydantoinase A [Hyphomicrobiales bacterium]MBX3542479.1 hydantoinase/oxoprolinase family protein [Chelatococcus sp.]MCO5075304.1 hydantoinase/oxoprolinase family protein [Chelatococcus sp.]CAH1695912.1 N-methylhydantoinase A [Hyphomicrobiales bacterium]